MGKRGIGGAGVWKLRIQKYTSGSDATIKTKHQRRGTRDDKEQSPIDSKERKSTRRRDLDAGGVALTHRLFLPAR